MRQFLVTTAALLGMAAALGSVQAADIPVMPVKAPVVVPVVYNWTGFYLGGNAGYSWGRGRATFDGSVDATTRTRVFRTAGPDLVSDVTTGPVGLAGSATERAKIDGWLGGVQAGYNWQTGAWVWGFETDFQFTGQRGGTTLCLPGGCPLGALTASIDYHLQWFGTFRARAGWLVDPRVLLYVTGGLAYGHIETDYAAGIVGLPLIGTSNSTTRLGWTIGGGIEGALSENWTVKLEYLYVDYGSHSVATGAVGGTITTNALNTPSTGFNTLVDTTFAARGNISTRLTDNIVRIGLNYRFAPGPVVARY